MSVPVTLSVIVPCFNAEATLAQQLRALASQKCAESWELLVVDNGSIDQSMTIAGKFEKDFSVFRILQAGDAKKVAAYPRNIGARAAQGDRLAFCDADDEVAPGWLAAMGKALDRHAIVCGKFQWDKFNDSRLAAELDEAWKDGLYQGRFLPGGGSGNLGIQRWVHDTIGGFEEALPHSEDADYFWRLQLEGFKLYHEPEAIVQVRLGRANPSVLSIYHRSRKRFASNYWCYKRYREHGMRPPVSLKCSFAKWVRVLKEEARVSVQHKEMKHSSLGNLAQPTGELVGQIQGRLTNPCQAYHPSNRSAV